MMMERLLVVLIATPRIYVIRLFVRDDLSCPFGLGQHNKSFSSLHFRLYARRTYPKMMSQLFACTMLLTSITTTVGSPVKIDFAELINALAPTVSSYAPIVAPCPASPLVRAADGISLNETNYRTERKKIADVALKSWLAKTNAAFATGGNMPTVRDRSLNCAKS